MSMSRQTVGKTSEPLNEVASDKSNKATSLGFFLDYRHSVKIEKPGTYLLIAICMLCKHCRHTQPLRMAILKSPMLSE